MKQNNPLNLRNSKDNFLGEIETENGFKAFSEMKYGYRAAFRTLNTYIKKGFDTVDKIINRWAPPSENNTSSYITFIVKQTGFLPSHKFSVNSEELI
ncbi:MAG: structural protein P5 [Tannerella sp.]|jgi:hypothetical protein|nr:structural protein P5 [Tannerella sp.]